IIPRPHGHAISKLSVLGHEGKTLAYRKDYIVHETGDGLSYLIEFRKKQPNGVRPSVEFVRQPTGPGINSELSSLDLDALAKINARLNKVGFTQIANALDQRIAFARKQGASLSMSDLESIVAHAGLYSYIKESQIDPRAIELDSTFGPHAKFLHQGVLCAQCDGANAFFADIMQEYFKAAGSKLEVFDASSLVNQAGILNDGIRHAQIGIRDPNSSDRIASFLIYDATAKRKDPRNPKSVETPQGDLDSQPIARTRSRVKDTIKELEANDTNLKATFSKYKHRVMKSASDPIVRTTRLNMIPSDLLGGKITLPDATALLNETLGLTGDDAFASFQSIDEMLSTIQQQARKTLTLIDRLDESKSLRTIQLPVRDAARTTLRTIDAELESINSTDVFDHWTGLDRIPDVDGAACSLLLIMQRAKSN
ncbi:MAG TPA: hypothetical protein PLH57_11520, partial [Oligoflexia bacterium]|nr:hypothetical protein [Oligoflexia bacterium]